MRGALSDGLGTVRVVDDLVLDAPGVGEVAVSVSHCGLCLTDVHIMQGHIPFPSPVVCGHEVAGVVVEVGPAVDSPEVGDHVILTCRPPCRRCYWCARGEPALCGNSLGWKTGTLADGGTRLSWRGQRVYRGVGIAGFAERVITPAGGAIAIPDDVPLDIAAVLGCAVQTGAGAVFNTAQLRPGQTALVVGLGGVGLAVVQAAKAAGAATIIGVDPQASRRAHALGAGLDIAVDPQSERLLSVVFEATNTVGVDVAFDVVADPASTLPDAFAAVRPGGTLIVVGLPTAGAEIRLPAAELISDERHISGCFLGSGDPQMDIGRLLKLWRGKRLDLAAFVTERRPLEDLPQLLTDPGMGGLRTVIAVGAPS